jgi:glutaredoxin
MSDAGDSRVVVYGKAGCHLCEDAYAVVDRVCAAAGTSWRSIDIQDDAELMRRYGEQLPVIFVDGRQHDYWRVDPDRLRSALATIREF